MGIETKVRQFEDVTIVDLSGRLTIAESQGLRATLLGQLHDGRRQFLLNLQALTYVDSAGLGELIGCYTAIGRGGGALKLLNVPRKLRDTMEVTRVDSLFEFCVGESSGIKSFSAKISKPASKLNDRFRKKE